MTQRIRIESVDEIDFENAEVKRLLAKGYAVLLKAEKDAPKKDCKDK